MELEIPSGALVILCGPSGSGKSTFARKHFLPTQIVSSDACRAMIADDPSDQAVSHLAFDLMHQIVRYRLLGRRLTAADSTALEKDARKRLRLLAQEMSAPAALILFDIPLRECLVRNAQRPDRRVDESIIKDQWNALQQVKEEAAQEAFDRIWSLGAESIESAKLRIT